MHKIILYTSSTCHNCHALKDYLCDKEISYEERNISEQPDAKEELIAD